MEFIKNKIMKTIFIFLLFVLISFLWVSCVFYTQDGASAGIGICAFILSFSFVICGYDGYIGNNK